MRILQFLGWCGLFALSLLVLAACDVTYAETLAMDAGASGLVMMGFAGVLINKEAIGNVFIGLKTTFNGAFAKAPTTWQQIAMLVPSTTGQNDYDWLTALLPKMRKWVGDKVIKSLSAYKYTVVNDDWETTVGVKRKHIQDDNLGIYMPIAQMAGKSAAQLPDEIVADLVNGSFASICFDGQYFCDTDHPVGDASVSNKLTVALSCATLAAADASLGAAQIAMMQFKDDEGRPLNSQPDTLLVPPALKSVANVLANNEKLEDGKPNPYKDTIKVVVDARLTSTTAWFVLNTTEPVKPFIYQERQAPEFVQQVSQENDDVFMRAEYKFGVEARAAGGYGFWQLCVGSTGAG